MHNQEIHVGKSYSMENCQWEQELQPYNQYKEKEEGASDILRRGVELRYQKLFPN